MAYLFDPLLFLSLAEEMSSEASEQVKLRTAVGRAYYAVFLSARARTGAAEVAEGAHSAVRRLLRQRGYFRVAQKLEELYNLRILADYDISAEMSEQDWADTWQTAHRLALELKIEIEGIRTGRLPRSFT